MLGISLNWVIRKVGAFGSCLVEDIIPVGKGGAELQFLGLQSSREKIFQSRFGGFHRTSLQNWVLRP